MAMIYTDEMITNLKEIGEFNFEDCKTFAEANPSVTARSVMAKVKSLGLVYNAKKVGGPKPKLIWGEEIPW